METAIRDYLKHRPSPGNEGTPLPPDPKPFTGGELAFFSDRVELNGTTVCGDRDAGIIRHILEQLAHRDSGGEYVRLPAKILALPFGEEKAQTVTDAINRFRDRVIKLMNAAGVRVHSEDAIVIREGAAGYQLNPSLIVHGRIPDRVVVPGKEREPTADQRQKWFLQQLENGKLLRRVDRQVPLRRSARDRGGWCGW